jgi:hypothetical protein
MLIFHLYFVIFLLIPSCFIFLVLLVSSIFYLIFISSSIRRLILLVCIPISFFYIISLLNFFYYYSYVIRDNADGTATGYVFGPPKSRSSSPGKVKISLLSMSSRPVLKPTQPPIQWFLGLFHRG